ncbi:MAG TPA: hypothetical protein PK651_02690, partial [Smithellaceae bacterium]|nr:hypothetical protein [Smithellaceae bacterium]
MILLLMCLCAWGQVLKHVCLGAGLEILAFLSPPQKPDISRPDPTFIFYSNEKISRSEAIGWIGFVG